MRVFLGIFPAWVTGSGKLVPGLAGRSCRLWGPWSVGTRRWDRSCRLRL